MELTGRVRRFGDNITTDYIITSTRKRETLDQFRLKDYLLETLDPSFAASVLESDLLVAGRNFGCGSAMEIAVTVILGAGIKAVLAESFSRTFYRNAINNGLLPVTCKTTHMREGQQVLVTFRDGDVSVLNESTDETVRGSAMGGFLLQILEEGGLVPYIRTRGRWES